MPKVLQNFLIGVGLDTENYDKGARNVETSLGRMRSLVGLTGAAITGAFAAAGTAAVVAGRRVDQLSRSTQGFKTSAQYVDDYGHAISLLGGQAAEAYDAIKMAETALSDLKTDGTGMLPNEIELQLAGVDTVPLREAQSGQDFMRELARQMPNLNKDQQMRVQGLLGLSDAVMISLRGGLKEFDAAIARAHDLAGNLNQAVGAAREFNRELAAFDVQLEGIGNTLAAKVLPGFTGILDSANKFLGANKETTNQIIDKAAENPATTAAVVGAGSVVAAGVASKAVGLGLSAGRALTVPGMALGAGLLLGKGILSTDWAHPEEYFRPDYSGLPDAPLGTAVPDVAPGSIVPRDMQFDDTTSRTPIYAGGEVSPAEAAATSPGIIMLRDQQNRIDAPAVTPRVSVDNHIDMTVQLDGRQMESKITDVIERRERDTRDDILSSVNR